MGNKVTQEEKCKTIKGNGNIVCQVSSIKSCIFSLTGSYKPWSFNFMYMVTIKIHHSNLH
jgi:hypothetical protein